MFSVNLIELADAFKMHGYEIRIVGGAVRDMILKQEPKDIDLCTNATPQEMINICKIMDFAYIPTGLQHGTITIVVAGEQFEVTTLRIDAETDGRHAVVKYTRSFELDASRRDLTINAMSMDFNGTVYDYFGGKADLEAGRVRFVGDADARVKEDYLRILRYFRFMARFGNIDQCLDEIKAICTKWNLDGLKGISVERYWLEMQKLVVSPFCDEVLDCMYVYGVLKTLGLKKRQFSTRQFSKAKTSPIGALSTMVDETNIDSFLSTWKLSSDESKQLRWLVNNRNRVSFDWHSMLVDGIPRQWVIDMAGTMGYGWTTMMQINKWDIPVFPVTGQDLLDRGMKPGVELGNELRALRVTWKMSRFALTKEKLLDIVSFMD